MLLLIFFLVPHVLRRRACSIKTSVAEKTEAQYVVVFCSNVILFRYICATVLHFGYKGFSCLNSLNCSV